MSIQKWPVRFGLVGAGAIAQAYVQACRDCRRARLAGVADIRMEASAAMAQAAGCEAFDSAETMAASLDLDAAIVCTPPAMHPEVCVALMKQGIHVLCEKPLAIDSESARRMFDTAEDCGVKLSMASKFRHVEDVVRAKAILVSGILGEIVLFENVFASRVDMSARWNSDPEISGGGVLIDNGTHSVDIMRFLLGPLTELQVLEGKRLQSLSVEDTVRLFVHSESGIMGSIDLSWSISKEQPNYISIYGSHGTVLVGWKESKYRRSSGDEWIVFGSGYDKVRAFQSQISNFAEAVRGETPLVVTPEDAMASVEVIEMAYEALSTNTWQCIRRDGQQSRSESRSRVNVETAR